MCCPETRVEISVVRPMGRGRRGYLQVHRGFGNVRIRTGFRIPVAFIIVFILMVIIMNIIGCYHHHPSDRRLHSHRRMKLCSNRKSKLRHCKRRQRQEHHHFDQRKSRTSTSTISRVAGSGLGFGIQGSCFRSEADRSPLSQVAKIEYTLDTNGMDNRSVNQFPPCCDTLTGNGCRSWSPGTVGNPAFLRCRGSGFVLFEGRNALADVVADDDHDDDSPAVRVLASMICADSVCNAANDDGSGVGDCGWGSCGGDAGGGDLRTATTNIIVPLQTIWPGPSRRQC